MEKPDQLGELLRMAKSPRKRIGRDENDNKLI